MSATPSMPTRRQHREWKAADHIDEYGAAKDNEGIYFVQGPASNWIIIRNGVEFTLIDGGYPADTALVLASIQHVGLRPGAAAAMLITHAHVDHTGAASYFAAEFGTPVLCSPEELPHLRGDEKYQVTVGQVARKAWRPDVMRWMKYAIQAGALEATAVPAAASWTKEILAELPGGPVAVPTPGHTPGHVAYHFPEAGVLATGDALVTGHPISRRTGAQLLDPIFHHRPEQARASLDSLAGLSATVLLPGHGPAAQGDPAGMIAGLEL